MSLSSVPTPETRPKGARLHMVEAVTIEEVPGLRDACEGESKAVQRIHDLKLRLQTAKDSIVLRQRDRDALSSRVAVGEDVTGADLRKATEAVSDAEGTVKLIEDALPQAISEAKRACSVRQNAENAEAARVRRPFVQALVDAESELKVAQAAVDLAKANVANLPRDAQEQLDAVLAHHGRDLTAKGYVIRLEDVERTNSSLSLFNSRVGPGQQRPLLPWPP